jgi:uncharacterized protein YceH (UPF0502 family)
MAYRTTIVLDKEIHQKVKTMANRRKLSPFINQCLREHFQREEREQQLKSLEQAYERAAKNTAVSKEFESIETEEWPE